MSSTDLSTNDLIIDTATRIFTDGCSHSVVEAAQDGVWADSLWTTLSDNGLLDIGLEESGTGVGELFEFLRVAGRFAAPLPLLESLIAQFALGKPAADTTFAVLQGTTVDIAWPERFSAVVALDVALGEARLVPLAGLKSVPCEVMLGEPVAQIELGAAWQTAADTRFAAPGLYALAALGRAAQMCGGLEASLSMAIGYCSEREQFGRTISKFQAIQHQLAVLASEVAASQRATDAAIHSVVASQNIAQQHRAAASGGSSVEISQLDVRLSDVAVAKVRVGSAVGIGAEIAHQVHGAMGFTMEYSLHQLTRRLWSWRDQFGTESDWAGLLGDEVCAGSADDLWAYITSHG